MLPVSEQIIDRATELRARHGFKTPDAIHLATALESSAAEFWTVDAALSRCTDIAVSVLLPTWVDGQDSAPTAATSDSAGRPVPRLEGQRVRIVIALMDEDIELAPGE